VGVTFWPVSDLPVSSDCFTNIKVGRLTAAATSLTAPSTLLARVIDQEQFDVVHSMEFQHAGYLTCDALDQVQGSAPIWIATNYGADIVLFGKDPAHQPRIRRILERCDYYSSECRRDLALAKQFGFRGSTFTILPNSGGIDISEMTRLRQPGRSSDRRLVAVKGYQHFAGRALTALKALELCSTQLDGYVVKVYSPFPEVVAEADRLNAGGRLNITCLPEQVSHEEILTLHGSARISLAVSIADGISTALLEAMAMGSFPIQTCTACADEWIVDGESGFIVPPDDPDEIARKLMSALRDDSLVDQAALVNEKTIRCRGNASLIKGTVVEAYRSLPVSRSAAGLRPWTAAEF